MKTFGRHFLLIVILTSGSFRVFSQMPYGLSDRRLAQSGKDCLALLHHMPPEVQFGIHIAENGDIFFVMNDKHWLTQIFSDDACAVSADIVSKDVYACAKPEPDSGRLIRGQLLKPVYRDELMLAMKEVSAGIFVAKIGHVVPSYVDHELEGNLVLVKNTGIVFYMNFLNIDRSAYHLLPMGLYTDTLLKSTASWSEPESRLVTYSKKLSLLIPFERGKSNYSLADEKTLARSLLLGNHSIRKIEIRAYSSVEGPEALNDTLMTRRARAIVTAIRKAQPTLAGDQIKIMAAENWLDFYESAEGTELQSLGENSKLAVKAFLSDKHNAAKYEALLASERKALVTVYLQEKTIVSSLQPKDILGAFNQAVSIQNLSLARSIVKEMASRISDNRLPADYIGKLKIPMEKNYLPLLSDQIIYQMIFKSTTEYEALTQCLKIQKLDPSYEKLAYNIAALRLTIWEQGMAPASDKELLGGIEQLRKMGADRSLVQRMELNYHILNASSAMAKGKYAEKDASLAWVAESYLKSSLSDQEIYSLAKFFSYYARFDLASAIVSPRIDKIDTDENLIFYYLNLAFANSQNFGTQKFKKAVVNAINLNRPRFCQFFTSPDRGGASFQLLEKKEFKAAYCASCQTMSRNP